MHLHGNPGSNYNNRPTYDQRNSGISLKTFERKKLSELSGMGPPKFMRTLGS